MFSGYAIAWLIAISLYCLNASAAPQDFEFTSLYIPGFEPQPIEGEIVGVGEDGHTTWALEQGDFTGSDSFESLDFPGTATLVEGSGYASLGYSANTFTIGQVCALNENIAICTIVADGHTYVQTEAVTYYPVQQGDATGTNASPTSLATQSTTADSTHIPEITCPSPMESISRPTSAPESSPSSDDSVSQSPSAAASIRSRSPFWSVLATMFCATALLPY